MVMLVSMSSYGQKFLKKYQRRHHIENLSNGYLVTGKGEFIVFDIEGNILFEHEKDAVVYSRYSEESNIIFYTIGPKLAKHACFRDTSSDVLCSYNVTTGENKEYLFRDVSYGLIKRKNEELLFFFTEVESGKHGIMKADETYLFKPEYDGITPFHEESKLYLAVKDNHYYVVDEKGNNVLGEKFVFNGKANMSAYYLDGRLCIRGTRDGVHVGLYDVLAKKDIIPFVYKEIEGNYAGGIVNVLKDKFRMLLDYKNNKVVIDESFKIHGIEEVQMKKGELFIMTLAEKSTYINNVIYKGKYLFDNGDDEFTIQRNSINEKSDFIWGTLKSTNAKVVYNFSKEEMLYSAKKEWLVDYDLVSMSYFEKNEDLFYFSVKEKNGKSLTTISDKYGSCLMPLDYGGRISIIEIDPANNKRFYQREHTDRFRAKITSVYKDCKTPLILNYKADNFRIQYDEERKLHFIKTLESRPLTPEQVRNGKDQSYYVVMSYYDTEGNLVDKNERFEYDR